MAGAVALLRACGALSSAPAAHNKGAAGDYVVFLRTTLGAAVPLEVGCEGTVADLERAAEAAAGIRCSGAWPASQLAAVPAVYGWPSDTLSFQGKVLADRSANLSDCGIGPESVVEVVSLGEVAPDLPRNYSRRLIVELQRRLQEDPPPGVRWYVKDRPAMEWVMQLKKGSDRLRAASRIRRSPLRSTASRTPFTPAGRSYWTCGCPRSIPSVCRGCASSTPCTTRKWRLPRVRSAWTC
eukprot:TRINITY_DN15394_c0_g1_i2.p2 TRINITY_DN15394_c0_g1~~TRINITY_DN15394_c0_g1_i2.p2  ORF type:complete len:275 (+),score=37.89 TRINITY_DN15394_c0_g1_i2:110-826(+)